jgi:hypothetical protein
MRSVHGVLAHGGAQHGAAGVHDDTLAAGRTDVDA